MSFLNGARVSPSTNTSVETELSVSLVREKDKNHFNNKEGKESANIDDYGANEYQEGLDGIPEQQLHNASSLFQNGKKNRPGSHCPKRLSWEPEGGSLSNKRSRYHTSDQVILISLCLLSAASVLLTLLMLFGVLEPRNCACANKTGISILLVLLFILFSFLKTTSIAALVVTQIVSLLPLTPIVPWSLNLVSHRPKIIQMRLVEQHTFRFRFKKGSSTLNLEFY